MNHKEHKGHEEKSIAFHQPNNRLPASLVFFVPFVVKKEGETMNTVWQSLLWKEWHENRWKLASLTVMLFAVPVCMLWIKPSFFFGSVFIASLFYFWVAPVHIAAGVCASEVSGGTLPFLQATPVDRRKWAFAKLGAGLFTVIAPLVLLLLFCLGIESLIAEWFSSSFRRELRASAAELGSFRDIGMLRKTIWMWTVVPTSVFIWSLAVGVNRGRELWAIACSLIAIVGLWLPFSIGADYFELGDGATTQFARALLPGGLVIGDPPELMQPALPMFLVAIISHAGLLTWYLTQFGRSTRHSRHSPKSVMVRDPASVVIRKPCKSKTSAILWMQMQEIAPLAVACVALILLPAILSSSLLSEDFRCDSYAKRFGNTLAGTTGSMGFFFAILIGVGVFLRDLEPGLNSFWRSSPIPASQWFWTKFLSAYAMLVVALALPAALLAWNLFPVTPLEEVILVTGLLTSAYTTAVGVTVLVRHAIYGCLLSMGIVLIPFLITFRAFDWDSGDNEAFYRVEGALQITLIVVTTLIAWQAVTRDWGWKR